jgi:glutamate dehydrogenase
MNQPQTPCKRLCDTDWLEAVLERLAQKMPEDQVSTLQAFATAYLSGPDPHDLLGRPIDDLYGAVLSHWHFLRTRNPEGFRVRVFNPQLEEHGWTSPHTVIEMVNDDRPFLLDSVTQEINRLGLTLHLIIHPVLRVRRTPEGLCQGLADGPNLGSLESLMHLEIDRRTDPAELLAIEHALEKVLCDVRAAVDDWPAMLTRLESLIEIVKTQESGSEGEDKAEVQAFLEWLLAGNFVLLGARDYTVVDANGEKGLESLPGSGLGVLRNRRDDQRSKAFEALPPALKAKALEPGLLVLTKSTTRSTVHRQAYLDHVGIKCRDAQGQVIGERRIVGLLTSTAYHTPPRLVPLLRKKIDFVMERCAFLPGSHAWKALLTLLESYPRDELFQISAQELHEHALAILRLGERQRTRLLVRQDPFGRFVSCLIFVPREHYNTEQRQKIQTMLSTAFNAVFSEFEVHFSESALARVRIVLHLARPGLLDIDKDALEQTLIRALRRWEDELEMALLEQEGEERGLSLMRAYGRAFPSAYRETYSARVAVCDMARMESLASPDDLAMSLYIPLEAPEGRLHFKLYRKERPVPLSQSLPMLEHMGVRVIDERPFVLQTPQGRAIHIHDFGLDFPGAQSLNLHTIRPLFQATFEQVWRGLHESDEFNRLCLLAGLHWREVGLLRAYARYLKQIGFTFSQYYMAQTLAAHPALTKALVDLFVLRFDPAFIEPEPSSTRQACMQTHVAQIDKALNAVANLDEDRILRQFLALIMATVRTNYFQKDAQGQPKPWLSFKFVPSEIPGLPKPWPLFEIFVYSPRVEGVHLRGAKVARGGLRWSDRMEDYRTEVLGLVKAQMVKNAVIVPAGSKGGFVVKAPMAGLSREAFMAEGVACYRMYLSGLLDITDNRVQGAVFPPKDCVRHDEDDPYLVVAADKGTATFSDTANAVSAEYGFWLGDAFASGGSAGYDHKKMGITARGAWESAKRHFREQDIRIETDSFTVVGIGDMSGDVFGNGLLRSRTLKLVAAFDHRHIFVDPNPDPGISFEERARLFALPRSSWEDYDRACLSEGGGVWPRTAKAISLSAQARTALGIQAQTLTPNGLIRAILTAPVDLLYNGGIGTYVKACTETDAQVGDRANEAVRVNGAELRCKVVTEGGNLGFTQRGRIEFARNGGRIYTDAIDNSGGVDCSDHEVNIKILLDMAVQEGELTALQRNRLLLEMTDEVAGKVLADNDAQTRILSIMQAQAPILLEQQGELIRRFCQQGLLDRDLEALPSEEELAERKAAHEGLSLPELAVLLAYCKNRLNDELMSSDVPEDPFIGRALFRYFPHPLPERFEPYLLRHPLRREIIVTVTVNEMINRVGPTFVSRLQGETGADVSAIVRAYTASRDVFGLVPLWQDIEALDRSVSAKIQTSLMHESIRLLLRSSSWFLRHPDWLRDLSATLAHFAPGVGRLSESLMGWVSPEHAQSLKNQADQYHTHDVPEALAGRIALLESLYAALDLVEVAAMLQRPEADVAQVYFALTGALNLHMLGGHIAALPSETRWQALARGALRNELFDLTRALMANALRLSPAQPCPKAVVTHWQQCEQAGLDRYRTLFAEAQASASFDMAMISVLLHSLSTMGGKGTN